MGLEQANEITTKRPATRRSGLLRFVPFVGSFAVYLIPLVGPHAAWLLAESLFHELTRANDRSPWWLAADVALALVTQLAVGAVLFWALRGSHLRLLVFVPAMPMLWVGLNLAYLIAIPSYFLIEPDSAAEVTDWAEHCFVPDVSLMAVRTTVNQPAAGFSDWWLQRPDGRYALLRLPECVVEDAALPQPTVGPSGRVDFMLGFQFTVPGGAATLERLVPGTSEQSFWLLAGTAEPLVPIEQPELAQGAPILSDTADATAWIERLTGSARPVTERVILRPLEPSAGLEPLDIELTPFGPASYTLLGVDTVAREAILWRNGEPFLIGFDGQRRELSFDRTGILPQASTYLRHRSGWVAWDAYRDQGPYWLSWSLALGSGSHRTNRGRAVTAAAVDPAARLIAVSESTTLNIGSAGDVVYVFRTNDGAEIFRIYLPRYTRSTVVFFAGGLFGYTDLAGTHILTIPP